MKLNRIGILLGLILGIIIIIVFDKPAQAGCVVNCWNRECASNYGYGAVNEPYRLTHAEWINDDQRTWDGEGVDCSGLVNKTWVMKDAAGSIELFWWFTKEPLTDGGYSAAGFYENCNTTGACNTICTGGTCPLNLTEPMDAFATLNDINNQNDNHIGLIYQEISNGQDRILEAVDQAGTYQDVRIITQTWRTQSKYRGIRRTAWSSLCSPCPDCRVIYLPNVRRSQPTLRGSNRNSPAYPPPGTPYP